MNHLKMHSLNKIDENVSKIATLFPNCVTEAKDENGEITHKIDFDMLKQELSHSLVEGREERYQFTWPDKKQAILTANAPINKTLRPCREESVNFDETENLYIEGDNLEALKLLQETYLGKIKMIYIDPPYNTGNDFVYNDDFSQDADDYMSNSGQTDEEGNRLVANTESNGRFHTDWLNMMYPRLKLARDLLSDDGVILVSIDYNENFNMRKLLDEIMGAECFIGEIYWESKTKSQNTVTSYNKLQPKAEMIFVYSKDTKKRFNLIKIGEREYPFSDEKGTYREHVLEVMNANGIRGRATMVFDINDGVSTVSLEDGKQWKLGQDQVATYRENGDLFIREGKVIIKMRPEYERNETTEPFWGFFNKEFGTAESAKKELKELLGSHGFETVKPVEVIRRLVFHATNKDDYILDFFSGSATTAHAVMQLNAEDGGHRKFIMVQLPEETDEKSEAFKAGYKNICEIGKERIRRAGQQILKQVQNDKEKISRGLNFANTKSEDNLFSNTETPLDVSNPCDNIGGVAGVSPAEGVATNEVGAQGETSPSLDIGFRVLKIDSTNMEDVYYTPDHINTNDLFKNNIKSDRTGEDLLFQTMLDLGIMLSSKIKTKKINGKEVFCVEGNYLMACFDDSVDEATITEIAKEKPYYFVMRDPAGSPDGDCLITNFEQIFTTYSPDTVRKVL